MANQKPNRGNRLITFLIVYAVFTWVMWQWGPLKPQPPRPATQAVAQEAQQLETEAHDQQRSLANRLTKYRDAIAKYQAVYHQEGHSNAAIDARYQELRLLNEMAELEKQTSGHYDQAETLLKDMEAHLAHKPATVVLQPGQPPVQIPDVGKDAGQRLNQVRAARDSVYKHDLRYQIMAFLVKATGSRPWFSYWFALVALTVILKVLLWPFAKKQFTYMRDMQRIAPLMKEMQEKVKSLPADEQQKRMMAFQREHGVSMTSGCLPMVLQAVVLIPVFYMVREYQYQFSKGYFLWIGSEFAHRFPAWLGQNLASFDVPMFVLYISSTVLYSLLQPKPADPAQAQQQKLMTWMMPIMFGFFMWQGRWSSAFMFYWLVQNLIGVWQQWLLLRRFGPPPTPGEGLASTAVPEGPLTPMLPTGTNGNGNGKRPGSGRVQPKKKKRGSRA